MTTVDPRTGPDLLRPGRQALRTELEPRHLKTIRAIADAGGLTRAATALGPAQPALRAQLKRVERALAGALFERGRDGVRATALGDLVPDRARVVLPARTGWEPPNVPALRQRA